MTPLVLHSGRVFQFKRKHTWKESWLTLEKNGTLTWKRKDGYQVKGTVNVPEYIHQIKVDTPDDKHLEDNGFKPFFMVIPIKIDNNTKVTTKRFAVNDGQDLILWLDAFATVVNEWKGFQIVREKHMREQAQAKDISDESVESTLTYHELVYYFKAIWEDYLREHVNVKALKRSISESECCK